MALAHQYSRTSHPVFRKAAKLCNKPTALFVFFNTSLLTGVTGPNRSIFVGFDYYRHLNRVSQIQINLSPTEPVTYYINSFSKDNITRKCLSKTVIELPAEKNKSLINFERFCR